MNAPLALVGGVSNCAGPLLGHALGTVGDVKTVAGSVATTGTATAFGAVNTVQNLRGAVFTTAGGLLTNNALSSILNISASGQANANVLAGLLGSM